MKAADGSTGNGDERKREDRSGEHRTASVNKASERGHMQHGSNGKDARCQGHNRPQFYEGAQVVSRRQQQPHRQGRCGETVDDDQRGQGGSGEREYARGAAV